MDNLPRVPKYYGSANKIVDKLSMYDLKDLNKMDDASREYFFSRVGLEIEWREQKSKTERIRALKLFFITLGICVLLAVWLLNTPTSEVLILIGVFVIAFVSSIAIRFIAIPIEAIRSAVEKKEFLLKEHLISKDVYMDGAIIVTLFILTLVINKNLLQ